MIQKRLSRWRRAEVIKLLKMAGWTSRTGAEGHIIAQKEDQTITLGSDPVHKNAIGEVQRALGMHIDDVVQKRRGHPTSLKQIRKRLELAKQMDAAGFTFTKVIRQCGLTSLYNAGLKISDIRGSDSEQLAELLYDKVMRKKGVTVKRPPKIQSPVGTGQRIPGEPKSEITEAMKSGDVGAILDLLAVLEGKFDNRDAAAQRLAGAHAQRLRLGLEEAQQLKQQLGKMGEDLDRLIQFLDISIMGRGM